MILPSQKYREYISIHAPREGGDKGLLKRMQA